MSAPTYNESDGPDEVWVEAYMDQVHAMVREHGWAIQGVFAHEDSDLDYDYAYTIGLLQHGCTAELMIVGVPMEVAAALLNQIAASMVNDGQMLPPSKWTIVNDYELRARVFVPNKDSKLSPGTAQLYYGRPNVPMAQYVWPDTDHRYPWDDGWDPEMVQPIGNE